MDFSRNPVACADCGRSLNNKAQVVIRGWPRRPYCHGCGQYVATDADLVRGRDQRDAARLAVQREERLG